MPKVDKRMQLINDNRLMKSVYLGRIIQEENGEELDGRFVWDEYKQLIEETEMEYSERKVKLHNVRSKMNAFIYQFSCKAEFMEDEQIGELYYIENGEAWEAYELDLEKLLDYPVWYADYEELPQTPYRFSMWQYSSTGSVTGIEGNVDLNIQLLKK